MIKKTWRCKRAAQVANIDPFEALSILAGCNLFQRSRAEIVHEISWIISGWCVLFCFVFFFFHLFTRAHTHIHQIYLNVLFRNKSLWQQRTYWELRKSSVSMIKWYRISTVSLGWKQTAEKYRIQKTYMYIRHISVRILWYFMCAELKMGTSTVLRRSNNDNMHSFTDDEQNKW